MRSRRTTLILVPNPKTIIHIGIAFVGFLALDLVSAFIGGETLPFMIAGSGPIGFGLRPGMHSVKKI